MTLIYLVNKPQVFGQITWRLLLFLEYDFIIVYKPWKPHVIVYAISCLPYAIKDISMPYQTIDTTLFVTQTKCVQDIIVYLNIGQFPTNYNLKYYWKLALWTM
jgi:hypothetical protein